MWAFHFWRKKTKGRFLWLRNNASTLVSQFIDTLIFCSVAFIGMFETKEIIEIFISTYVIKALVSLSILRLSTRVGLFFAAGWRRVGVDDYAKIAGN